MKFSEIPQFPTAGYKVMVGWEGLEYAIHRYQNPIYGAPLNLEPDFQREHVWSLDQQRAYIEYVLQGGEVGKNLIFNFPGFQNTYKGPYEIIDGKQRLQAARKFMANEIKVFGQYHSEFGDTAHHVDFLWCICSITKRSDILKLYLNINAGGTPHTDEELERVRILLREEEHNEISKSISDDKRISIGSDGKEETS